MGQVELPFGRTEVTVAEVRQSVAESTARDELAEAGVSEPKEVLEQFFQLVPDLLIWLDEYGRDFPWRRTTDAWRIYATEILLRRTKSSAVADIYHDFFDTCPTPEAVLEQDERTLRDLVWSLGLVDDRVQALQEAAELCVHEHDGSVPADIKELQKPAYVGRYTARACLLFAFHRPLAIIDTNTARVIGRFFDYPLPAQPHKSDVFYEFSDALVPEKAGIARAYNLALLDLGALVCSAESPNCTSCPLRSMCKYVFTYED